MLLDTECCVALVAAGEARIRAAIARCASGCWPNISARRPRPWPMHSRGERPNTALDRLRAKPAARCARSTRPSRRNSTRSCRSARGSTRAADRTRPVRPRIRARPPSPADRAVSRPRHGRAAGRRARFTPLGERVNVASLAHHWPRSRNRRACAAAGRLVVAATFAVPITLLITATPCSARGRAWPTRPSARWRPRPRTTGSAAGSGGMRCAGSPAHARTGSASTSAARRARDGCAAAVADRAVPS